MRKVLVFTVLAAALASVPAQAEGLRDRLAQRGGGGGHGEHAGEMMKAMDTNGDGAISKAEFVAGAEQRFAKMDKNGDGVLTKEDRPAGGAGGGHGGPMEPQPAPVPGVTTEGQ